VRETEKQCQVVVECVWINDNMQLFLSAGCCAEEEVWLLKWLMLCESQTATKPESGLIPTFSFSISVSNLL